LSADQTARLAAILAASPRVMTVLEGMRAIGLPDPLLVSGAVYQTAWNAFTGRDPDYGIKDYDAVFFDPDTSWDAEDAWIRKAAAWFDPPLDQLVEVRNQARVHIWFPDKYGEPYEALGSASESLERFVCPAFSVGARLGPDGAVQVVAPYGLDDLFSMTLRPNPTRPLATFWTRVTENARARWPELTIVQPGT
jgi:uncharacterized protein